MKIAYTEVNLTYCGANSGLASAYAANLPFVISMVEREFGKREDGRTLVIVLTCPCCMPDPLLDTENAVLVSPLNGIDPRHYRDKIHCADKMPPYRTPGVRPEEAADRDDYLACVKNAIETALAA